MFSMTRSYAIRMTVFPMSKMNHRVMPSTF
jgi:hypothetical protein